MALWKELENALNAGAKNAGKKEDFLVLPDNKNNEYHVRYGILSKKPCFIEASEVDKLLVNPDKLAEFAKDLMASE